MKRLRYAAVALLVPGVLVICARIATPFAAHALIRNDRLAHADMIVVLGARRIERTVEAGTLFKEGWSPRILLLRPTGEFNKDLVKRLRIRFPVWLDIQKDVLAQLGVPSSAVIEAPFVLRTTREEAAFIGEEARRLKLKRVIVVTSAYHTARAGRYVRAAAGPTVDVVMRANRYEKTDPDHWWREPLDRGDIVLEYMKWVHGFVGS